MPTKSDTSDSKPSNSLKRLVSGEGMTLECAEKAIETLALISALVLTIPYGIMSAPSAEFWDKIIVLATECPDLGYANRSYVFYSSIRCCIYTATASLIMTAEFFLLKPTDVVQWWPRGRLFLGVMFALTWISVISIIVASNVYIALTEYASTEYCTDTTGTQATTAGFLIAIAFVTFILLF